MKWELNTVQNADVNCSTKLLLNTVKSQPFVTGWLFWSLAYKKMFVKKGIVSAIFVPTHIFIITLVKKMCKTTLADCFHKSGYIIYVNDNIKYKQFINY